MGMMIECNKDGLPYHLVKRYPVEDKDTGEVRFNRLSNPVVKIKLTNGKVNQSFTYNPSNDTYVYDYGDKVQYNERGYWEHGFYYAPGTKVLKVEKMKSTHMYKEKAKEFIGKWTMTAPICEEIFDAIDKAKAQL